MDREDLSCDDACESLWPDPRAAGSDPRAEAAREHLRHCPACARFFMVQESLGRRLERLRDSQRAARPELHRRIAVAVTGAPRGAGRRGAWRRSAALLAVAAAAVLVVSVLAHRGSGGPAAAFVRAAMRQLPSDSTMDSSDSAGVARWLGRQVGMPLAIPAIPGAKLMGGRVVRLDNTPVAGIVYRMHGVALVYLASASMTIAGMTTDTSQAMMHMGMDGYQVAVWGEVDGARALVAPMTPEEVHDLVVECRAMTRRLS
jgi:hypothetical protein